MLSVTTRGRMSAAGALAAGLLVAASVSGSTVTATAAPSPAVQQCDAGAGSSAARVADGSKAVEPKLYPDNEANAYGVLPDAPYLGDGAITIRTVFHMVSDDGFTAAEKARWKTLIADQMKVLNDSYSGATAADAADTPFRFRLADTTWTTNPAWYTVVPGKNERDMKKALHQGDSRVLNVYAANIGGGLLGWSYFPKGYNNGRDYVDGVVMLDESMPGGVNPDDPTKPWKYGEGDTLTHEVGHWLMLEHTFAHGCSASGDYVADTPREAHPQFDCPVDADTCSAPGLDPIHNFMDYTQDSCMNMFTEGQAERMSDAWVAFRAGGNGGK
ncbi:zinc metalloprotease [Phycicoccus duodecadis]|uniref:Pregnancy-associated plasma protein-A n=1 Tax=Phycicoccus duodecadis TaxID=173053 RepID=A0A2N3YMK0_9MICO|nr:zinc metalloprotease [Phycicoccus duodecadis]PKW28028.1 pregnancy-associated plasma protein-A [Phycicoccus duodecadis]